ncbi:WXG100 family type VII secretion target [Actinoplanes tereljensis]|uniref:ESAT-6-like protein n=1 Tax=Paractinoplanes tereljensis TaxID=571912 RepID=A0A919NXC9_9ACTN|nr:WXG100 family type VII secretion target [Actinoplanes tereljensis]GIF25619.1 hypothetical protein Ate02nite_83490 [Actinoplanes tereljensis]
MSFELSGFSVHHNSMLESGDELDAATKKIRATLDNLEAEVARFSNTNSGMSVAAFGEAKLKWDEAATNMNNALALGRQKLEQIHNDYVQADQASAQNFYG